MLHKTLKNNTIEIWAKPLPDHEVAILVLNTGVENITVEISAAADVPGRPAGESYRDTWEKQDVPIVAGKFLLELAAHDNIFAVLSKTAGYSSDAEPFSGKPIRET